MKEFIKACAERPKETIAAMFLMALAYSLLYVSIAIFG